MVLNGAPWFLILKAPDYLLWDVIMIKMFLDADYG